MPQTLPTRRLGALVTTIATTALFSFATPAHAQDWREGGAFDPWIQGGPVTPDELEVHAVPVLLAAARHFLIEPLSEAVPALLHDIRNGSVALSAVEWNLARHQFPMHMAPLMASTAEVAVALQAEGLSIHPAVSSTWWDTWVDRESGEQRPSSSTTRHVQRLHDGEFLMDCIHVPEQFVRECTAREIDLVVEVGWPAVRGHWVVLPATLTAAASQDTVALSVYLGLVEGQWRVAFVAPQLRIRIP